MRQIKISASRKNALLSRLVMEGGIIPTLRQSDGSISLILDEGIAFAGDLSGRALGADPMHQVENELADASGIGKEIYP